MAWLRSLAPRCTGAFAQQRTVAVTVDDLAWAEGFDLGNHTYSHPDFNDLSPQQRQTGVPDARHVRRETRMDVRLSLGEGTECKSERQSGEGAATMGPGLRQKRQSDRKPLRYAVPPHSAPFLRPGALVPEDQSLRLSGARRQPRVPRLPAHIHLNVSWRHTGENIFAVR